jgi:hypothetical protein
MGVITDPVVGFRPKGGHTSVDTNVRYVPEAVIRTCPPRVFAPTDQ